MYERNDDTESIFITRIYRNISSFVWGVGGEWGLKGNKIINKGKKFKSSGFGKGLAILGVYVEEEWRVD